VKRARRPRGSALAEVVFATALALVLIAVHTAEVARQARELDAARGDVRVRTALASAYERLQAGVVAPPAPGDTLALEAGDDGVVVTVARTDDVDPRLARAGLVAVVIQARAERRGAPRAGALTALVPAGGAR